MSTQGCITRLIICGIFLLTEFAAAWQEYLTFNNCYNIYRVTERHSYLLSWTGHSQNPGCRVSFHGYDSFYPEDKYQICITVTNWTIENSELSLTYYSGRGLYQEALKKEYMQSDNPVQQWCSEQDEFVDILLKTTRPSPMKSYIKVQVTGTRTFKHLNYRETTSAVIGGIIGVVILCSIAVFCRRWGNYCRKMATNSSANDTAIYTVQSRHQQQEGLSNPGQSTESTDPPPYDNILQNYDNPPPYSEIYIKEGPHSPSLMI
ncbi:uncharacterized protein LOC127734485 [Mytilus californianus]|uniref:uncharacterized protein LOC127734485 n=1 Tax=Mytilus californianus TaxID=6549 RepID=UPI002246BD3C|nr:uncharacterized protein LOC127734485 [Mytilus californianus]